MGRSREEEDAPALPPDRDPPGGYGAAGAVAPLANHHRRMLEVESGIAPAVIAARGYRTATTGADLEALGFAPRQRRVPSLVIPLWGVTGGVGLHQIRPDTPRHDNRGRALKYEVPASSAPMLDIPPALNRYLGDPRVPLLITEGSKKVDALASRWTEQDPFCAINIGGVWLWRGTNSQGGKTVLPDWEDVALNNSRRVYLVFDGDVIMKREVHAALARLKPMLGRRGATVLAVYLPATLNGVKCGVDDFLVAEHQVTDLLALAQPILKPAPAASARGDAHLSLPEIEITTDISTVVDAAQNAILHAAGGPHLYQRSRLLCFLARGVPPPRGVNRPHDAPVIVAASQSRVRELAAQFADWKKLDRRSHTLESALPPPWVAETLQNRAHWPFPVLEGIITAPALRPDGSILETPGYDAETGLVLDPNGTIFPPVPRQPTLGDARSALEALREPFRDFPFQADRDRAGALAAVLSLVSRFAIQGNVPCFPITSTVRGSGKSLLVDAITILATGQRAPRWAQAKDEDEERKRLLTIALEGDAAIALDNITLPLGNSPLDMAVTALEIKDRLLGTQTTKTAIWRAVIFATGNNLTYRGDMARRVVPIHFDPQMERPEEREGFQHPRLLDWVTREHPRLVAAALTVLRAYHVAGRPQQSIKPIGSFEEWSALIRSALLWAGEADPASGREAIEAESDGDFERLRTLLLCWYDLIGSDKMTLQEILQRVKKETEPPASTPLPGADGWEEFRDALGAFDVRFDGKTLKPLPIGNSLKRNTGRIIDGLRLARVPGRSRRSVWFVAGIQDPDGPMLI